MVQPFSPAVRLAPTGYQPGLHNLRAVAALAVCLFHFTGGQLPERETVPVLKALFAPGYLGVEVFFVVSGFVIPYSLLRQGYRLAGLGAYLKRRFVRLGPPAHAVLLLTVAGALGLHWLAPHAFPPPPRLDGATVLSNLLFTVSFFGQGWLVPVCWTLAVELQFYLLLGLLFPLLFGPGRLPWFVALYAAAATASRWLPLPGNTFLDFSSLFALGGVALWWQQGRLPGWAVAGCLAGFGALAAWQLGPVVAAVGLATALACVLVRRPVPGLAGVGTISYSLYLTHVLVGRLAEGALAHVLAPTTPLRRILILALCLGAALGAAALFYRWVEQPFVRLAARWR